jgi:prepilin-type N-terminal cleavage/methylation domain-containing protein
MHRTGNPLTRRGFTLVELLVVIVIILIVSVVALPTVLPALQHRQVSEGARILQAALTGARDSAIKNNRPSGIRLLPDPVFNGINPSTSLFDSTQPLAYNRIIPIAAAPDYTEGVVMLNPTVTQGVTLPYPCLFVAEGVLDPTTGLPNAPTSWFWNVRVGDKIQFNNAGAWYTVVGPLAIPAQGATIGTVFYANNELFVNAGPPGTASPLKMTQGPLATTVNPEYLFLVNGQDDNSNGWTDEGFDGVDNNGNGTVDELAEWESEVFLGSLSNANPATQYSYTIRRRPAPTGNAREVLLPTNVVVDATTWGSTQERSQLPVNPFTGYVDIVVNPTGTVIPNLIYSAPSIVGMGGSFLHFWLAERSDVYSPPNPATAAPQLPIGIIQPQLLAGNPYNLAQLKGEYRLITLFTRTGQVTTSDNVTFDNPANPANQTTKPPIYNPYYPFIPGQQGVRGGQR